MSWTPKKNVIVPIDFSDESFKAVSSALELVESPASLHVIHVLPKLSPMEPGVIWSTVDNESRSEHAKEAIQKHLAGDQFKGVDLSVRFGDPAHEITAFAEESGAELIVIPSHGKGRAARILLGSVAQKVIGLAHCPVLVYRE